MNTALKYACDACDTMIRKFTVDKLPPEKHFHYHQGVFLSGMQKIYNICKNEKYFNYIRDWVNYVIDENGKIDIFECGMLDDIQPGILLFELYDKTKDERYKKALDYLAELLKNWNRNEYGGFWHKEWHPNQLWLDTIYMCGPIQALYGKTFGKHEFIKTAAEQAFIINENMKEPVSGLYYHAWDPTKSVEWANAKTGLSSEIWGRALGWYAVATLDIMECMNENDPDYEKLANIECELLKNICKYQDKKSGMWYQVVNKPEQPDNWTESSCTCLFVCAVKRAADMGIIDKSYLKNALHGFEGMIKTLRYDGEDLIVSGVCVGTSVCSYDKYVTRPTSKNDLHGVGAFLLMCAAMAK